MRVAHFYVPLLSFPFSSPPSISFRRIFRAKRKKRKTLEIPRMVSKKKKRTKKKYRERILFFFFFCFLLTALELDETGIRFKVSWQKWGQKTNYWIIIEGEGKNLSWCKYLGGLKFGGELLLIEEIRTVLVKSFGGKIDPSWECVLKI